jgi:hypothetical protein
LKIFRAEFCGKSRGTGVPPVLPERSELYLSCPDCVRAGQAGRLSHVIGACQLCGFFVLAACIFALINTPARAKEKEASEKTVDSGSFGVYNGEHRVATETFSIGQGPQGSVVTSEFKSEQGEQKAEQSSRLELTPSVDLRQYTWKESLPGKNQATVTPNDTFLIERFSVGDKQNEQNFLLPASTTILDDYFFIQREILAWKYLHTACRTEKGTFGCPRGQKVQFGTLNPHERSSMAVSIEFGGKEKVTIRGKEQELNRFLLRAETGDWAFWLDDQFKLLRLRGEDGTEVIRD